MNDESHNLSIAGGPADDPPLLADFVKARLSAAAGAYWTAVQSSLGVPWNDCFSKSMGMLCESLAERDDLLDVIERTSEGETGLAVGQNGEMRKHPLYARLNQVELQAQAMMHRFGMTPAGLKRASNGEVEDGVAKSLHALIS